MRLVAQILLSNTQRVCNKKEGMMTAEEILQSAAMTRLLLTACATFHRGRSKCAVVHGDGGG